MPTYEYECKSCSHNFEVFQSMSDPPLKDCPRCGKEVRRLIFGGAGVIFKGSGFYVTDKSKANKTASAAPAHKNGGSSAKSDAPLAGAASACAACPNAAANAPCSGSSAPDKPKSETKTA